LHALPTSPPVTAAIVGLVLGVLTNIGRSVLSGGWLILVNSGAVWAAFAFLCAALLIPVSHPRIASHIGTAVLAGLMVGYYMAVLVRGTLHAPATVLVWIFATVVAGPVFGIAGTALRSDDDRHRQAGIAVIAAVFAAEGLFGLWWVGQPAPVWTILVAGGLLAPAVLGPVRAVRRAYTIMLGLVPVLIFGYWLIDFAVAGDILSLVGTRPDQ